MNSYTYMSHEGSDRKQKSSVMDFVKSVFMQPEVRTKCPQSYSGAAAVSCQPYRSLVDIVS